MTLSLDAGPDPCRRSAAETRTILTLVLILPHPAHLRWAASASAAAVAASSPATALPGTPPGRAPLSASGCWGRLAPAAGEPGFARVLRRRRLVRGCADNITGNLGAPAHFSRKEKKHYVGGCVGEWETNASRLDSSFECRRYIDTRYYNTTHILISQQADKKKPSLGWSKHGRHLRARIDLRTATAGGRLKTTPLIFVAYNIATR